MTQPSGESRLIEELPRLEPTTATEPDRHIFALKNTGGDMLNIQYAYVREVALGIYRCGDRDRSLYKRFHFHPDRGSFRVSGKRGNVFRAEMSSYDNVQWLTKMNKHLGKFCIERADVSMHLRIDYEDIFGARHTRFFTVEQPIRKDRYSDFKPRKLTWEESRESSFNFQRRNYDAADFLGTWELAEDDV